MNSEDPDTQTSEKQESQKIDEEINKSEELEPPKSPQNTEESSKENNDDYGDMKKTEIPAFEKEKGNEKYKLGMVQEAAKHYSKALLGMQFLIKDNIIQDQEVMLQMIKDIEIPCNLNIAQCYLKMKEFKNAITHASKVLEIETGNIKAYYRRGLSYMGLQEFDFAKEDLKKAYELDPTQPDVISALNQLKQEKKKFNDKLKQISQKMINALDYSNSNEDTTQTGGVKGKIKSWWKGLSSTPRTVWNSVKYHCKMIYLIPVGFISERCCKKRMPASFFKKSQ